MRRTRSVLLLLALSACSAHAPSSLPSSPTPSSTPSRSRTSAPFVFAVKGDWGGGTAAQRDVTNEMCSLRKRIPFTIVVTTGDNFYNPDGFATQQNYYGPERCLYSHPGHVWRAVWGNHDLAGSSTRTVLGAARYYTFSEGLTQFFMLDANRPNDDVQRRWLRDALAASRARVKIAVFHQPGFTSGLHDDNTAVQKNWVPLFEQYHVNLVLTGHNHDYEHLKIHGIDYVVTGGGGRSTYPCLRVEPGALRCVSAYNFLLVTVSESDIEIEAIRSNGRTLDRFSIRLP
jgi:tartrate-resistant acid phosphatase type 5